MRDGKKISEMLVTAKTIQYLMIAALLACAFVLPGTVREQRKVESFARQTAERKPGGTNAEGKSGGTNTETKTENGNAQGAGGELQGTIVLDAGHGGDDPGMTGRSGISEKVLNLVYAKKLKALLEQAGWRVVMTRETEDGLYDADAPHKKAQDMQRRVAVIAREQPVMTVSIHQNSYQDAAVCGPQVFYYEHSTAGKQLAKAIQDSLNTGLSVDRPRVEKGNSTYYILKRSVSPTVIVECGFLSNPQEEEKLQQEEYQNQVVQAICEGIQRGKEYCS